MIFLVATILPYVGDMQRRGGGRYNNIETKKVRTVPLGAGLEGTEESSLLLEGLEGTVPKLGGGIDELELDLLEISAGGVDHKRLADSDDALLRSRDGALDHEEVVLDNTVVGEATHGGDGLLGDVGLGGGIAVVGARSNAVDLLVELGTVMVAV